MRTTDGTKVTGGGAPGWATHVARLGDDFAYISADNMTATIDQMMARRPGAGVPRVESLYALAENGPSLGVEGAPTEPPAQEVSEFGGSLVHDPDATERIERQHAALRVAGVAVDERQQLYGTGTRMTAEGYETQARRQAEHEQKQALVDAAAELAGIVERERRVDIEVAAHEVANAIRVDGRVTVFGKALREQAVRGILLRIGSPAVSYVVGLRDRIAAEVAKREQGSKRDIEADKAVFADVLRHELLRHPDVRLKLRARAAAGDIYAAVSPRYVAADAPVVLGRLVEGMPADARGSIAYDPSTTSWELRASVWTPTPVAEQAVGEPFEGYASFCSRDDGAGSFRVGGGVTLLRCLNASTYSVSTAKARRRHVGDVLHEVREMVQASRVAVDTLCEAWGNARQEEIRIEGELYAGMPMHELVGGIFFAELRNPRSELAGVLPGRSAENARDLAVIYGSERRDPDRIVRADLAQAWTRYCQAFRAPVRREAEVAVGSWLATPQRVRHEKVRG